MSAQTQAAPLPLVTDAEVERYLGARSARAAEVRAANERLFPPDGTRERLHLALRRSNQRSRPPQASQ